MRTTNSLGQPISQAFKDAWEDSNVQAKAMMKIEFGNNRFNGDQVVTASSEKIVNKNINDTFQAPTAHFWTPDEAFNNKNRESMRWGVCDRGSQGARAWGPNSTYAPYRAVNLDDVAQGEYEHGWWSQGKSNGSGQFASPEWVQCIFETPRNINQIWLFTDEAYPNMQSVTIFYRVAGSGVMTLLTGGTITLDQNTYINKFDLGGTFNVDLLSVNVYATYQANDFARISELQGIYFADVSTDIISVDVQETREKFDGTVPVGILKTATSNGVLDNSGQQYSPSNTSSPYYPYVAHDNRVEVYMGVDTTGHGGSGIEYVQMGEYFVDQWDVDSSNVEARYGARDYGKALQDNLVGFSKVWRKENVGNAISDLIQRAGKTASQIFIDQYALREFPLLYVHDVSFWNFLAEVAFADQAFFGFDSFGNFTYESYQQLLVAPYTTPVYTLDWDKNIVTGTTKTELYLNRVIVDVNAVDDVDIGLRDLWNPPSPTVLGWNFLSTSLSATDMTINVSLNNGPLPGQNFYTPIASDGTVDPLAGQRDIFFLIDTELIYCNQIGANTFQVYPGNPLFPVDPVTNPNGRGWGGTVAKSHGPGTLVGEAKYWDNIQWTVQPALSWNHPFATAIDSLPLDRFFVPNGTADVTSGSWPTEPGRVQAAVVLFNANAFGCTLAIGNMAPYYTPLVNSQGQSWSFSTGLPHEEDMTWGCAISGVGTLERHKSRRQGKASLTNKRLIRKHGKNEIEIQNPWIQTQQHANDITNIMIKEYNTPRSVLELQTFGNPLLELADRVTIQSFPELGITNRDYHIVNITYNYDGGLQSTLSLREALPGE